MTCKELVEFIMKYRDGELAEAQRAEFEAHLQECPWCVEFLRSYDATIDASLRLCQLDDASAIVPEEMVQAILAAQRKR